MVFPPTPDERDPRYFRTWQRVSVVLQKSFRQWVRELYFRDIARFADRDEAFVMIVFSVCRPCYGTPRSEFTYDAADPETLTTARRSIGQALRNALAPGDVLDRLECLAVVAERQVEHRLDGVLALGGDPHARPRSRIRAASLAK